MAAETTQHIEAPPRAVILAVGTGAAPETGAKMDTTARGDCCRSHSPTTFDRSAFSALVIWSNSTPRELLYGMYFLLQLHPSYKGGEKGFL